MNYMAEINAFYDWQEANRLTASAICLWHALMNIANKARWPDDFSVAISTLESKTRYGKDMIYMARNLLKQKGRIGFKEGRGSGAAVYRVISFASEYQTQAPTQPPSQPPPQPPNMIIQDNTKPFSDGGGDAPVLADEFFGITPDVEARLRGLAAEIIPAYWGRQPTEWDVCCLCKHVSMHDWSLGEPKIQIDPDKLGVLKYAFRVAAEANASQWDYISGVLANCSQRGLQSAEACESYDEER